MAHALGLTQTSYSKIEKNAAELSLNRLSRICEILEIQLPDLLNEKGSTFYSSDNKGTNNQTHGSIIINNFPPELMQRLDALLDKLSNKTS